MTSSNFPLRIYSDRISNAMRIWRTQCPLRYVRRIEMPLIVAKRLAKASLSFWNNFGMFYIRLTITTDVFVSTRLLGTVSYLLRTRMSGDLY